MKVVLLSGGCAAMGMRAIRCDAVWIEGDRTSLLSAVDEMTLDKRVLDRLIVVGKAMCAPNKTTNAHTTLIFITQR
jgi:hypothetical protein